MTRLKAAIFWTTAVGLGLIACAGADGPTRWKKVRSGSAQPADAPLDDALSRASYSPQEGATLLPPVSGPLPQQGGMALPRETVPPPPTPMEALPVDSNSVQPSPDGSNLVSIHFDNSDLRQALEIFGRKEKMNLLACRRR